MVKKPSKSILLQKCLKIIFLISGVICLLLLQGTFQVFAMSGSDIRTSEDLQQKVVVTGTVVDARNNPMAGVNVLEKGTTNGVMAGIDGKYSITVSSQKSVLVFSFVGYEPQRLLLALKQ
jgi:hypothetical protein